MKATYEFVSHPEKLASVRSFVRGFLVRTGLTECEVELLVLGIDEACSNIIRHAYGCAEHEPIVLSCERGEAGVCFRLRDFGRTDPACLNGRSLDRVAPGGLGLHLIRQAFDEVTYQPQERGTELVLLKRLVSAGQPAA